MGSQWRALWFGGFKSPRILKIGLHLVRPFQGPSPNGQLPTSHPPNFFSGWFRNLWRHEPGSRRRPGPGTRWISDRIGPAPSLPEPGASSQRLRESPRSWLPSLPARSWFLMGASSSGAHGSGSARKIRNPMNPHHPCPPPASRCAARPAAAVLCGLNPSPAGAEVLVNLDATQLAEDLSASGRTREPPPGILPSPTLRPTSKPVGGEGVTLNANGFTTPGRRPRCP